MTTLLVNIIVWEVFKMSCFCFSTAECNIQTSPSPGIQVRHVYTPSTTKHFSPIKQSTTLTNKHRGNEVSSTPLLVHCKSLISFAKTIHWYLSIYSSVIQSWFRNATVPQRLAPTPINTPELRQSRSSGLLKHSRQIYWDEMELNSAGCWASRTRIGHPRSTL